MAVKNVKKPIIPVGVEVATAWSWRWLVIAAAILLAVAVLAHFAVIVVPIMVALLMTALLLPLLALFRKFIPKQSPAALLTLVTTMVAVAGLLTFAGRQVGSGSKALMAKLSEGIGQVRDWLATGPLQVTDQQIKETLDKAQESLSKSDINFFGLAGEVGTTVGHVFAGLFITLFATYFFLADGNGIWSWVVRLFPKHAEARADISGRVAWESMTKYVRATVIVAAVDAIGIMIVAAILQVPFVFAIGVLVFFGSFIPMVGATLSGMVAILLALVEHGPWIALWMLCGVILVQQIEAHVLQPFLMGKLVSVHPLGIIVALGCGVVAAGIVGALFAVPIAASIASVFSYWAKQRSEAESLSTAVTQPIG